MTKELFVGIDQSYTGFAFVVIDQDAKLIGENVNEFAAEKYGHGIDRLLVIHNWVLTLLYRYENTGTGAKIAQVAMEGYSAASKFGREQAGELGAIVKLALREHFDLANTGYPTIVQPSALKKFVTDNGAAKKNLMLLAVYRKWGYETTNDNLADAYSLARVARAVHLQTTDLAYEKTALQKVKPHTEIAAPVIAT